MKRYSLPWILILIMELCFVVPKTGFAQTPRENAEARKLYNEGVQFQHGGDLAEAEKKFREALRKYPKADQADKTAYFLIDTLVKLGRFADARTEIESFRRNYPKSNWQGDVNERTVDLGGLPRAPSESAIWNSPAELREAQARADLLRGAKTPDGPPDKIYSDEFPPNASMQAELLRVIVQVNPNQGIEDARELLKTNPSHPAVAANLGTIGNSNSPQVVPFLLSIWATPSASPNMRNSAFFWFSRRNPNKEEVARAIMDLLTKRETERVASEALYRMTVADHRAVLEKIVMSSNPAKFDLMGKIFRNGSQLLKSDLLMFVGGLTDPNAVPFILQAAQNDPDPSVRRTAIQALRNRKDVDVATLQKLMNAPPTAVPTPPRPPAPLRVLPPGVPGVIVGSAAPSIP